MALGLATQSLSTDCIRRTKHGAPPTLKRDHRDHRHHAPNERDPIEQAPDNTISLAPTKIDQQGPNMMSPLPQRKDEQGREDQLSGE